MEEKITFEFLTKNATLLLSNDSARLYEYKGEYWVYDEGKADYDEGLEGDEDPNDVCVYKCKPIIQPTIRLASIDEDTEGLYASKEDIANLELFHGYHYY